MSFLNKKILKIFFFGSIFCVFFLFSYSPEFFIYHENLQKNEQKKQENDIRISQWNIEKILPVSWEIFSSQEGVEKIISVIEKAEKNIFLEVYTLTHSEIIQALVEAHDRGVDVRVILEKNVYANPSLNNRAYETFESHEIPVSWGNDAYTFTHAKIMMVDNFCIIGTGNFSQSTFSKNLDIFFQTNQEDIYDFLENIFLSDWSGDFLFEEHPSLILSPENSEEKIRKSFQDAKKSIEIYAPSFSYIPFLEILQEKEKNGVDVRLYLGVKNSSQEQELRDFFEPYGIEIFFIKKPYIHAKIFFLDKKIAYIGSINFTENSLFRNREVGIFLQGDPFKKMYNLMMENISLN